MGWLAGRALAYLTFQLPKAGQLAKTGDGLAAIGFTCVSYAAIEVVGGYGFVAVFISALTLRSVERGSSFHSELHDFGEQIERLMMMVLLVCFGAVLAEGTLLAQTDWRVFVVAVVALAIIRPLAGWVSLLGCHQPKAEKAIIAIFGIRGLGSIYYLAFATQRAKFEYVESLWATVFMIILISVVVHGIAVTPVMGWIDRERGVDSMRPMKDSQTNE